MIVCNYTLAYSSLKCLLSVTLSLVPERRARTQVGEQPNSSKTNGEMVDAGFSLLTLASFSFPSLLPLTLTTNACVLQVGCSLFWMFESQNSYVIYKYSFSLLIINLLVYPWKVVGLGMTAIERGDFISVVFV